MPYPPDRKSSNITRAAATSPKCARITLRPIGMSLFCNIRVMAMGLLALLFLRIMGAPGVASRVIVVHSQKDTAHRHVQGPLRQRDGLTPIRQRHTGRRHDGYAANVAL